MEKYARQALAEGVKNAEELMVNQDSELYRVLNLHYNRNNQIEVSEQATVTQTYHLRLRAQSYTVIQIKFTAIETKITPKTSVVCTVNLFTQTRTPTSFIEII